MSGGVVPIGKCLLNLDKVEGGGCGFEPSFYRPSTLDFCLNFIFAKAISLQCLVLRQKFDLKPFKRGIFVLNSLFPHTFLRNPRVFIALNYKIDPSQPLATKKS